jgi:hypothetical protein
MGLCGGSRGLLERRPRYDYHFPPRQLTPVVWLDKTGRLTGHEAGPKRPAAVVTCATSTVDAGVPAL